MYCLLMPFVVFFLGSTLLANCGGKKKEPAAKSEASKSAVGPAPASAQAEPAADAEKKAE
ncbi:hypothetical protein CAEBREN_02013 [Caenorhabditis brenneri]|uniref:Lipoprotein n=1 Tax=Caenorhabditis brenneri TaxID=135651 RepID=G0NJI0_CAEBE|nr:hypothetical protein CAEBREN_02013 [Caenorhabditis brenneri]